MEIRSGRQREASEIVRYKKAAAVGRLLLGELDDPMEPISVDQYIGKPRRDLVSQRDASRSFLRGEVAKFCRNNFENVEPEDLAKLYDLLFAHGSNWFIPLTDFERDFGRFKVGILKGAPLHSTIHISPWGLQTEYPELHMLKDLAGSLNEAIEIEEKYLTPYRTKLWRELKQQRTRSEIAELIRRRNANLRTCILSCFNLTEAYINGIAWDYAQTHDVSNLSQKNREILTEDKRPINIVTRLIRIPALVTERNTGPLHQTRDPLKSFIEVIKPYRDAIVHASPFASPEQFGGYDKLSKIYDLNLTTVRTAVDVTVALIREIHQFVNGGNAMPPWFLKRNEGGLFILDMDA